MKSELVGYSSHLKASSGLKTEAVQTYNHSGRGLEPCHLGGGIDRDPIALLVGTSASGKVCTWL